MVTKGKKWNFNLSQFNCTFSDDDRSDKTQRSIGWENPTLFLYIRARDVDIFIDGTFSITPFPFYQCLILMFFCQQTNLYAPIMYILMTGKTTTCYLHVLDMIICCVGIGRPKSVTCDFKKTLFTQLYTWLDGKLL